MLNTGNWKQKAGLMGLGSVFTIVGLLFAIGMLPSVTAAMGINEYGDGGVSTWDKNGYRQ